MHLFALFAAGVATFASPCVLPLVPVYLTLLIGTQIEDVKGAGRARAVAAAIAFWLGLATVFVVLGLASTVVARGLAEHRGALLVGSGAAIALLGLVYAGWLRAPWLHADVRPAFHRASTVAGLGGAFLLGAAFTLGWSPCVGPVLASVLAYTASSTVDPARGALLLGVYAAGLGVPLVALAAVAPSARAWLRRVQRHLPKLTRATGVLMIGVGLWIARGGVVALRAAPAAEACAGTEGTCAVAAASADAAPTAMPHGPAVVEFVGEHCPVCARMAPVLEEAGRTCLGTGAKVIRVDVGTPGGGALAARWGVRGTPTIVLLDGRDAEVERLVGEQPLAKVQHAIEGAFGLECAAIPTPASAPSG